MRGEATSFYLFAVRPLNRSLGDEGRSLIHASPTSGAFLSVIPQCQFLPFVVDEEINRIASGYFARAKAGVFTL